MATYYVIRTGWNAANQSAMSRPGNPRNTFESGLDMVVAIVEADSSGDAVEEFDGTTYNGQFLWATTNPRQIRGLTHAIREFRRET
ncbi:MAG: hypothetical protein ACKO0Z_24860 [Betaproteobacteria bacterium]